MSLVIDAPIRTVWAALADWESQSEWMLQTTVEVTSDIREALVHRLQLLQELEN